MSKADTLIYLCLSFIGGILIASFFIPSIFIEILICVVGLILIGCFWKDKRVVVVGLCFVFFSFGLIDFNYHLSKVKNSPLIGFNQEEVSFVGIVDREVERGFNKSQAVVDTGKGKVLITIDKYSQVEYKDKIKVTGKIEVPEKKDNFDYSGYLAKEGISATLYFPAVEVLSKGNYQNVFEKMVSRIYLFKNKMGEEIRNYVPSSLSPIAEGLILGNDSKMDKETKDKLSKSGLSHIIAISGSHIVVFSAILFEVLLFLGFWRKQAQVGAIIFTFLYVFLVGLPASAVRAGIMVSLLFLSQILGRQSFNLRTLVLAAFLILWDNPLLMKFDLGFQLSFLAVLGLILMGPVFNQWLNLIFRDRMAFIRELLAMTFSAQVFTIPLLIHSFGYFSVVSLVSNILAVPPTPLLMALGLLLPLMGMILPILGWIIAIPLIILLYYLMIIVNVSSSIPFVILNLQLPIFVLFLFYLPFLYLGYRSKRKEMEFLN